MATLESTTPNSRFLLMLRLLFLIPALLLITGCATNAANGPIYDPWEPMNRKVYAFNDGLDRAIVKPVAKGYRKVTPDPVETGVKNFFSNLNDVTVLVNDLLQGKFKQAASDASRLLVNSTIGIGGLIDWGTPLGLEKHNESFGQTLGVWGFGEGPYVVLPLYGPNNIRTTAGFFTAQATTNPTRYITDTPTRIGVTALSVVSIRAQLLDASSLLDSVALDPYQTTRDFWITRHRNLTWDGEKDVRPMPAADPTDEHR